VAGRPRLSTRTAARLLALLAIVLLVHAVALNWLWRQLEEPSLLKPLATPMFTRLLRPEAPAVAPQPPADTMVAAKPKRPRVRSVPAVKSAVAPKRPASAPQPAEASAEQQPPAPTSPLETTTTLAPPAPEAPQPPTVAAAGALDAWPADTRLNYRLGGQFRGGELHGDARVQWQREGSRYQTRVDIAITLLTSLVLTSQGDVTPEGLLPRVYEELRSSGPRGARLGDETVTLANGRNVPRPPGVQDTASQFVELSHRFATGKEPLEVGRSVSFWMARPGGVDLWTYDIADKVMFQTPELGTFEAFHLKPRPIANPRGNITAEMWFAPSLQFLPVRIRVSMGEATFVDLMVVKIEQR
jgi:hypothetical protein